MSTQVAIPEPRVKSRRAFWVRQAVLWHWTSSAVCLGAMVLFTVTGITLNHAADISSVPVVTRSKAQLPNELLARLTQSPKDGRHAVPPDLAGWLAQNTPESGQAVEAEYSEAELYISLPRPGGDRWISVKRDTGAVEWEQTDRGWVSYFNDLHKGRHTGRTWQVFIDVIAVAFLVFTITGLILLQIHAAKRPTTWPAIAFGFAGPTVILIFFLHR